MKEDEIMSCQERSQSKTQLVNDVVEGVDVDGGIVMKCLYKNEEMMSYETQESHGLDTNHSCVYVGYEDNQNKVKDEEKIDEGMTKKILMNGMMGDSLVAEEEEIELLEEWLEEDAGDEYFT